MSPKVGMTPVRREQIVRATIRCLVRDGYSGLRMKEIARTAGISQGILHYYFENKRAILLAALEMIVDDVDRRLAPVVDAAPDARAQLSAVIKHFLAMADENREFWLVFVEFWGEMMHDRDLLGVNATLYRRMRRSLGAVVARGVQAGLFRRIDPEEAGGAILALVDGISLQRTFDPSR